jgi:hypothetical protein
MGKIVEVEKLDNGYWQLTTLDPVTQTPNKIRDLQFYQVSNKSINLKNYPYSSLDNSYIYFDKSYSPEFISQLIYLYTTFAYTNGILDKDVNKITSTLKDQGLTMTKYGISQINDSIVLPCIDINPYPIELQFKCLNDSGDVIKESEKYSNNYGYVTGLFNFGHTKITVSLWNFSYIIFGGLAMFLIIFLLVLRIDK